MKNHKPSFLNRKRKVHKLSSESGRFKKLYGSSGWKSLRKAHLSKYSSCQECGSEERLNVDHVEAHNGSDELFNDLSNLKTLCQRCHSVKTSTKDQQRDSDGRFKKK